MRKTIGTFALALAAVASAGAARAQSVIPLAVEARASAAVPTGDFADFGGGGGIGTGYGFGARAELKLNPLFSVYGGYSWTGYDYEDVEETLTQQGADAGIRLGLGRGLIPLGPYARGGIVYHKLEDDTFEGESKLGYEVGGGLSFPLGLVISVTPEVTYTRINDALGADRDLSAVRFGVGLRAAL
ncbi:MAG TPA: outer membrane beta-barrel protein [Longimicrobiaceae bacterium]|jgi:opacity protein-like surface antigen